MKQATFFLFSSLISGAIGNNPIPKPECDSSKEVSVRYSSSSNRIYVESVDGSRGGCMTLDGIYESLGSSKSPLVKLSEPGEWFLSSELFIEDGITLEIVDEYLKMKSDEEGFVFMRAHGGSLGIMNSKITSWDMEADDVDTNFEDGRAFISAISEVMVDPNETCQGAAKNDMGEARMDVENSEIAYMGYNAAESWGFSYKTRGLCSDLSNIEDFDSVGVYGNILDSEIHHLYYGTYHYGHLDSLVTGNKIHSNEIYGYDGHHGSVRHFVENNEIYDNKDHGAIWSKLCTDVIFENNHVHDNGKVGVFPHYIGDNALISNNLIENNSGSGIAFLESSNGVVTGNTVRNNVHGIRFSVGSRNNVVLDNTFEDNEGFDVYTFAGNDEVVKQPDNNLVGNVVFQNTFSGNPEGFRFDDSVDSQFVDNTVSDSETFEANDSDGLLISGNEFPSSMEFDTFGSCVEFSQEDPCGSEPMVPFTSLDATRVLDGVDDVSEEEPLNTPFPSTTVSPGTTSPSITLSPSLPVPVVDTSVPTSAPTLVFSVQPTGSTDRGLDSSLSPTSSPTTDALAVPADDDLLNDLTGSGANSVNMYYTPLLVTGVSVSVFHLLGVF